MDITEYEWSDKHTFIHYINGGILALDSHSLYESHTMINKDDAIAIAKHFNLFDATIYRGDGKISILDNIPQSETTYNSEIDLKAEGFNQND